MIKAIRNLTWVTLLSFTSALWAQPSIAVVNLMQVFQHVPQGLPAFVQLQQKYADESKQLQMQEDLFNRRVQIFELNKAKLRPADEAAQMNQLIAEHNRIQQLVDNYIANIREQQQQLLIVFGNNLRTAVVLIAQNNHYHLVLSSQTSVYKDRTVDITPAVIKAMQ